MSYATEDIKPYDAGRGKTEQVQEMFDSIAPAYDFMNRAMTFGIDRRWRAIAVKEIAKSRPASILDIATGTGDLALLLHRHIPTARIIGLDLSANMLEKARLKADQAGIDAEQVQFEQGDSLNMRFPDDSFDAITVAYGVRNFEHIDRGYAEMLRVLRPGGTLCVIELSVPANPIARLGYNIYTRGIIPLIGRLVSHDRRAYSYLPESIAAVPQREAMTDIMTAAGFANARFRSLTLGVCTLYFATK